MYGHTGHYFKWVGFSGGGCSIVSGGWRCVGVSGG